MRAPRTTVLLLVAILTASCETPKDPRFEDAARLARLNGSSVSGAGYIRSASGMIHAQAKDALFACHHETYDHRGTRILLKLDDSGRVGEAVVFPESELASCAVGVLEALEFPPPPRGEYWLAVQVGGMTPALRLPSGPR